MQLPIQCKPVERQPVNAGVASQKPEKFFPNKADTR